MTNRVVVTGMALTSPLGSTVRDSFLRLHKYENCIEYDAELEKYKGLHTRLDAQVKDFVIPESYSRKVTRTMGKVSILSVVTAEEALKDAGLINHPIISSSETATVLVQVRMIL